MDWNKFRRPDWTIDLVAALESLEPDCQYMKSAKALLRDIERLHPIVSRQAAAIAIVQACGNLGVLLKVPDPEKVAPAEGLREE